MTTAKHALTGSRTMPADNIIAGTAGSRDEVLSFHLAEEEYAVDILRVHEIRGWGNVTRIPRMPGYVKGVLNLRGAIVPVIDLRLRFGLRNSDYGPATVIIIVSVQTGHKTRNMGIVADAVSDVYALEADELKPVPEFGKGLEKCFLKGLVVKEERMIIVLDIDRVLNSGELALLEDMNDSETTRTPAPEIADNPTPAASDDLAVKS